MDVFDLVILRHSIRSCTLRNTSTEAIASFENGRVVGMVNFVYTPAPGSRYKDTKRYSGGPRQRLPRKFRTLDLSGAHSNGVFEESFVQFLLLSRTLKGGDIKNGSPVLLRGGVYCTAIVQRVVEKVQVVLGQALA